MRAGHDTIRKLIRAGWILMFLLAIVGAVGEYRGWWNLLGEVFVTVGTLGGLVLGGVDYLRGASEAQVETVQATLDSMDGKLGTVDIKLGKLDTMDRKLDGLETMDTKLDVIQDALVHQEEDEEVSKLDVVQTELDRQTGVLDRQVQILGEIRDAL